MNTIIADALTEVASTFVKEFTGNSESNKSVPTAIFGENGIIHIDYTTQFWLGKFLVTIRIH